MKFIQSKESENNWYLIEIKNEEVNKLNELDIEISDAQSNPLNVFKWVAINENDPSKLLTTVDHWQSVIKCTEKIREQSRKNKQKSQKIASFRNMTSLEEPSNSFRSITVSTPISSQIPATKETRRLAALSRLLIQTDLSIENWWICLASSYSKAHGDSLLTSVNRIIDSNAMRSVILGRLKVSEGLYSILSELDAIGLGLSTKHGKFSELSSCWNSEQEIVQALLHANDIDNEELKTFKGILALNNDTLKNQANQILNAIFPLQKEINLSSDSIKTQLKNFRKQYESIQIKLSAFNPEDKQLKQKHAESVNALENQLIAIKQVAEDLVTLSNKDDNCKKWLN